MIRLIFSALNMLLFFIALFRYRKDIKWALRSGSKCYNCKDFVENERNQIIYSSIDEDFRLCKACERIRKIKLIKSKFSIDTFLIRKYLLSKRFSNVQFYMMIIMGILTISDIFLSIFYKINYIGYISMAFNTIFYTLWLYSVNLSTNK